MNKTVPRPFLKLFLRAKAEPTAASALDFDRLRDQLLNDFIVLLAVAATPPVLISASRAADPGWLPLFNRVVSDAIYMKINVLPPS